MFNVYRMQGIPHVEASPGVKLEVCHLVILSTGATLFIGTHSLRLKVVNVRQIPYQVLSNVPVHQVLDMVFLKAVPHPFAAIRGPEVQDHQSHIDLCGHLLHGGVCHQITRALIYSHFQKKWSVDVLLHCLEVSSEIVCQDLCQI